MPACGIDLDAEPQLHQVDFWTSHEALLLGYEEALTRQDSLTGDWYDCSAHMLWIGERTRAARRRPRRVPRGRQQPDRLQGRPDGHARTRSSRCASALDPDRIPGRLTLITRMGAEQGRRRPAAAAARRSATPATPSSGPCDPMHGNTFTSRRAAARPATSTTSWPRSPAFFAAHRAEGTWPGGVHVELTGDDVTECLGGAEEVLEDHLDTRYETMCDPRLNARQSLDLAFRVAELLRA